MKQRLIDADVINKRYVPVAPVIDGDTVHYEWVAFIDDINEQPTVDAEPVRHGKWITCPSSDQWKCSVCGCRAGYWFNEENSGIESWEMDFSEWLSDYCPNCGAYMKGTEDD